MVIAIFEYVAMLEEIERFKLYDFSNFIKIVKEKVDKKEVIDKKYKILYDFIKCYNY